ncbi:MAG: hypothetical protein JNM31_11500 [Flavobacteriales bacterium]|nr:hypothetical protein [Flavobacteriales bacterium]
MKKNKANTPTPRDIILEMLRTKACMKQDLYHRTIALFAELKDVAREVADDLEQAIMPVDKRVTVHYRDKGETSFELKVAGDVTIFHMHTNIFRLDQSHNLWKSSYLSEDEMRGYFGLINVYNFLSDSFKYNRERDIGYLIARIHVNKEGHFYVQGKRQLGFLYNDLPGSVLDRDRLKDILQSIIMYVLDFDLLTPPYDQVNQVTVSEMNEMNMGVALSTGKRLGFRFQSDGPDVT